MSPIELHRFALRVCFYPLVACTMLGAAFLGLRYHFTGQTTHGYFIWNTFLAWIPYFCAIAILWIYEHRSLGAMWMRWPLAIAWLAFFPNAPYLVTDLAHFDRSRSFAWWYDAGLMLTFAWMGCFLGIVSLNVMQEIAREKFGRRFGWILVASTIVLSGVGIYLGRFVRLNSWDLVLRPGRVVALLLDGLNNAATHQRTVGVTLMFSAFLFVCYFTWTSARPRVERDAIKGPC